MYRAGEPTEFVFLVQSGEFELARPLVRTDEDTLVKVLEGSSARENILAEKFSEIKDVPLVHRLKIYGPGSWLGEEDALNI